MAAIRYLETGNPDANKDGLGRRKALVPAAEQLMILCIDTSLSMKNAQRDDPEWTRSHEVFHHLFGETGLFRRLEDSSERAGFWTSVIAFDKKATDVFPASPLIKPDGSVMRLQAKSLEDLPILKNWGQPTSTFSALFRARAMGDAWLAEEQKTKRFVTICIVSDGGDNDESNSGKKMADDIKQSSRWIEFGGGMGRSEMVIATAPYGHHGVGEANWKFLNDICTDPHYYYRRVTDGAQLRNFLLSTATLMHIKTAGRA